MDPLFSFLAFLVIALVMLAGLGLTDQGLWPGQGMIVNATAMKTELAVSTINLFANAITVGANTVPGDLVVPTFTGYAAQALATVPDPVNDALSGGVSIFIPSHVFTATAATAPPETMYGWCLLDTAGKLIACGNFSQPIVIAAIGDSVALQVTLNFQTGAVTAFSNLA
jgi:hypothetical protein